MRNRARALGCLLVGTSMISIAQPTTAAAAVQASQAVRFYDIPAQPLGTALSSYAEISGVDLVANEQNLGGVRGRHLATDPGYSSGRGDQPALHLGQPEQAVLRHAA